MPFFPAPRVDVVAMQSTGSMLSNAFIAIAVGTITIVALLYKYIFRAPAAAKSSLAPSAQPATASGRQDDPAEAVANNSPPPSHKGLLTPNYHEIYGPMEEDLLVFCPGSRVYNPARKPFRPGFIGPSSIDRLMQIDLRFRHFIFLVLQSGRVDKETWMQMIGPAFPQKNAFHTYCLGLYQQYADFKKRPQEKNASGAEISRRFDMYWLDKASPHFCTGGCKCDEIGHFCERDDVEPFTEMMRSFTSGRI